MVWGWMGRNGDEWGGCRVMWGVWVWGNEGRGRMGRCRGGFSLESRPYTVVVYLMWLSLMVFFDLLCLRG